MNKLNRLLGNTPEQQIEKAREELDSRDLSAAICHTINAIEAIQLALSTRSTPSEPSPIPSPEAGRAEIAKPRFTTPTALLLQVMDWYSADTSSSGDLPPELHAAITRFLSGVHAAIEPPDGSSVPRSALRVPRSEGPSALPQMTSVLSEILGWNAGLKSDMQMRDTLRQDAEQLLADHQEGQAPRPWERERMAGGQVRDHGHKQSDAGEVGQGEPATFNLQPSTSFHIPATLVEAGDGPDGQSRLIFHATQQDIAALPILPLFKKCDLTIQPMQNAE